MKSNIGFIDEVAIEKYLPQLAVLLVDGVNSGASISFIQPFTETDAIWFWSTNVKEKVSSGENLLCIAELDGKVVGTAQLIVKLPPNQHHRCEVSKLIVHSDYRGNGIGKSLMNRVISKAISLGKKLITLDTRSGDVSQKLYESLGFNIAGSIPEFALDPDGKKVSATTYMYKLL